MGVYTVRARLGVLVITENDNCSNKSHELHGAHTENARKFSPPEPFIYFHWEHGG